MPAAAKLIHIFGVRAKLEATYNVNSVPAAIDAIQLAENPVLAVAFANDGAHALPPGTMGFQNRVAPSGRTGETTLKFEPVGFGSAYSAANLPRAHALFRACGLDATIVTTVNLETVTYTPTPGPTGFGSVSMDLFSRGQQYALAGIYGDLTMGAVGPVVPLADVHMKGLVSAITDAAVPALTYTPWSALLPPKAVNVGFTINGVTVILKSWQLKTNRATAPRLDQNVGGHAGWAIGLRAPTLEVEIENPAIATLDPHALHAAGTPMQCSLTIGSVQYNRYVISSSTQAQIIDVTDGAEGPTATSKIKLQLNPSALGANDEFSFTFN